MGKEHYQWAHFVVSFAFGKPPTPQLPAPAYDNPTGEEAAIADWRTCEDGLGIKVKPKQGDCVLFWSAKPDLAIDAHALHGACAVVSAAFLTWPACLAACGAERPINALLHGI